MAYPPLVTVAQLAAAGIDSPGVTQAALDVMSDDVRGACGWHIAPEVTETLTLDSDGAEAIALPTLQLSSVEAVQWWDGAAWVPLTGWDAHTGWSEQRSSIYYPGGFPRGRRRLQVTVTHGYLTTPPGLLQGVVRLLSGPAAADVAAETLPGHAVTYHSDTAARAAGRVLASSGALSRYALGPRP